MFGCSRVLKIKANNCVLVVVFIRKGNRGNEKTLKSELNRDWHEMCCFFLFFFFLCKFLLSLAEA